MNGTDLLAILLLTATVWAIYAAHYARKAKP